MKISDILTTDDFIDTINDFPEVAAKKSLTYGIIIYRTKEDMKRDLKNGKELLWIASIDPKVKADDMYSNEALNVEEEEAYLDIPFITRKRIDDLLVRYINTPLPARDEWPGEERKESLRHLLEFERKNTAKKSPEYTRGMFDGLKAVFNIVDLRSDYEATMKPKRGVEIVLSD